MYIAGHNGMVGSALLQILENKKVKITTRDKTTRFVKSI